jgi:hypothetical protein
LHYLHHNIQGDQSWCAVTKWVWCQGDIKETDAKKVD